MLLPPDLGNLMQWLYSLHLLLPPI
jgi:hypothetical protein